MLFLTLKVVFLIQHIGLPPTLYWLDCHLSHLYLYCVYAHLYAQPACCCQNAAWACLVNSIYGRKGS